MKKKKKKQQYSAEDGYITDLFPPGSSGAEIVGPVDDRVLFRPEIYLASTILYFIASLILIAAVGVTAYFVTKEFAPEGFALSPSGAGWIGSCFTLLVFIIIFRKILPIWVVKCYQHYAPDHVRKRCLFTPSCSEYMILSIQKYGAIRGIIKGIGRLRRCHTPNGGEDYP